MKMLALCTICISTENASFIRINPILEYIFNFQSRIKAYSWVCHTNFSKNDPKPIQQFSIRTFKSYDTLVLTLTKQTKPQNSISAICG